MTAKQSGGRRKLGITSEDRFDLGQAKASYAGMPLWQRLALWGVLGLILLGILGDLIF